jgi:hypothetical protein
MKNKLALILLSTLFLSGCSKNMVDQQNPDNNIERREVVEKVHEIRLLESGQVLLGSSALLGNSELSVPVRLSQFLSFSLVGENHQAEILPTAPKKESIVYENIQGVIFAFIFPGVSASVESGVTLELPVGISQWVKLPVSGNGSVTAEIDTQSLPVVDRYALVGASQDGILEILVDGTPSGSVTITKSSTSAVIEDAGGDQGGSGDQGSGSETFEQYEYDTFGTVSILSYRETEGSPRSYSAFGSQAIAADTSDLKKMVGVNSTLVKLNNTGQIHWRIPGGSGALGTYNLISEDINSNALPSILDIVRLKNDGVFALGSNGKVFRIDMSSTSGATIVLEDAHLSGIGATMICGGELVMVANSSQIRAKKSKTSNLNYQASGTFISNHVSNGRSITDVHCGSELYPVIEFDDKSYLTWAPNAFGNEVLTGPGVEQFTQTSDGAHFKTGNNVVATTANQYNFNGRSDVAHLASAGHSTCIITTSGTIDCKGTWSQEFSNVSTRILTVAGNLDGLIANGGAYMVKSDLGDAMTFGMASYGGSHDFSSQAVIGIQQMKAMKKEYGYYKGSFMIADSLGFWRYGEGTQGHIVVETGIDVDITSNDYTKIIPASRGFFLLNKGTGYPTDDKDYKGVIGESNDVTGASALFNNP